MSEIFENAEFLVPDGPSADTPNWLSLDPRYKTRLVAGAVLVTGILIIALVVAHIVYGAVLRENGLPFGFAWLYLVPLALGVPMLSWPFISVPRMGYALRDRDILYKSGVLWRTTTAVPFNRVQHVEKSSTPLDRHYDIANLKLYTAGGKAGDLKINGLPAEVAEKLRLLILEKIGALVEKDPA